MDSTETRTTTMQINHWDAIDYTVRLLRDCGIDFEITGAFYAHSTPNTVIVKFVELVDGEWLPTECECWIEDGKIYGEF